MPYEIRESGPEAKRFCVHRADTGETVACHSTKAEADAHMRALYANAHDSHMDDDEGESCYRLDIGRITSKVQRTPQGGIYVDGTLALSRVLEYTREDGTIQREWFPPEEAKRQDYLDSIENAPLTFLHPPEMVTPANFREYNRGHAVNARFDEASGEVRARLVVQDADLLHRVDSGEAAEISQGYDCKIVKRAGVTPSGERYDVIQRKRIVNHDALGPRMWARAGQRAALHLDGDSGPVARLDSHGNAVHPAPPAAHEEEHRTMATRKIDGIDFEVGSVAEAQALERFVTRCDAEVKTARADADKAQGELAATKKLLDTANAALGEAKARQDKADAEAKLSPARTDAMVVLGTEAKLDGMSLRQIHEAAIIKADPEQKCDGLSDDYVAGLFAAAVRAARAKNPSLEAARRDALGASTVQPAGKNNGEAESKAARAAMIERNRNAWRSPAVTPAK